MKKIINIIIYAFILVCMLRIFLLFQSFLVLYILLFLVIFPFLSIAMAKNKAKKLEVSAQLIKEAIDVEQEFYIMFKIKNPTIIPIVDSNMNCSYSNTFYGYEEKINMSVPIYAKGKQVIKLPVKSDYCGIIDVNINSVIVWDMLHVWSTEKKVSVNSNIVLYPIIKEAITINPNEYVVGEDDSSESHKKGSDFAEISDIREYIPGDSLKSIHWKLSSKKDELMVKEHTTMSSKQIAILVELYNDDTYILDDVVDLSYSLCMNLINQNFPYTIYWWSEKIKELKERTILNLYDVEEVYKEIFYEKPYNIKEKALTEFSYIKENIENILYISGENYNPVHTYKRAFLTYKEV